MLWSGFLRSALVKFNFNFLILIFICFNWRNRNRRSTLCSKVYPEQENITEDLEPREERWDPDITISPVFSLSALLSPVLIVLMYGVNVCSGYFAMLVAMTYSVELFTCMIVGLVLGHALFNSGQQTWSSPQSPLRNNYLQMRLLGKVWTRAAPLRPSRPARRRSRTRCKWALCVSVLAW